MKESLQESAPSKKEQFETWFAGQGFYKQLRFIHGERLFIFDHGIGYRNITVQVAYVAFHREDVEFVLND